MENEQRQAEATAERAARKELAGDYDEAFKLYVTAAGSFLHAARTATEPDQQRKWKAAAQKAVDRADKIKGVKKDLRPVRRDRLSNEQQWAILDRSSYVNGLLLPLWTDSSGNPNHVSFHDSDPELTNIQQSLLSGWKRPSEIFSAFHVYSSTLEAQDIVQETVTDCSVVAALAVCVQHNVRWSGKLGFSAIHPQDAAGIPRISPSGVYAIALHLNGARRSVVIDDRLPMRKDGTCLCVSTGGKNVIWPSLVEKAYLKVMGGYSFDGSNGSIDLHAITGWIPEHMEILDARFQREKAWNRIRKSFAQGKCLMTVGTGKAPGIFRNHRLTPNHAYAVIHLQHEGEDRLLTLWNPWGTRVEIGAQATVAVRPPSSDEGSIIISWDDLCARFDSAYLNWDPGLFVHRVAIHSSWEVAERRDEDGSWTSNHEFTINLHDASVDNAEILVLLSRHIREKQEQDSYLAAHVFHGSDSEYGSMQQSPTIQATYTDSPHVLVRTSKYSDESVLSVIASRHGPGSKAVSYTLTVYSHIPFTITEPSQNYPFLKSIEGAFTSRTAGGNAMHSTFMHNPQYSLVIRRSNATSTLDDSRMTHTPGLRLTVYGSKDLPVHIQLVWGGGKRIFDLAKARVLKDSGTYNYGFALCETELSEGTYTVIVSSFQPAQLGKYKLQLECSHSSDIEGIPPEGAGMFSKKVQGKWSRRVVPLGSSQPTYELTLNAATDLTMRLQHVSASPVTPIQLSLHVLLETGSPGSQIGCSGAFTDSISGAAISMLRVEAGSYVIVPSVASAHISGDFQISIYSSDCAIRCIPL